MKKNLAVFCFFLSGLAQAEWKDNYEVRFHFGGVEYVDTFSDQIMQTADTAGANYFGTASGSANAIADYPDTISVDLLKHFDSFRMGLGGTYMEEGDLIGNYRTDNEASSVTVTGDYDVWSAYVFAEKPLFNWGGAELAVDAGINYLYLKGTLATLIEDNGSVAVQQESGFDKSGVGVYLASNLSYNFGFAKLGLNFNTYLTSTLAKQVTLYFSF